MDFLRPYTQQILSLLRIMSGLLLLQHGTTKYLNYPAGPMNNASPMTMGGFAGILELVGGVLLIIGLFTRPAFILSGMCAVAYFWAHAGRGFFPCSTPVNWRRSTPSCSSTWQPLAVVPGASTDRCAARRTEAHSTRHPGSRGAVDTIGIWLELREVPDRDEASRPGGRWGIDAS